MDWEERVFPVNAIFFSGWLIFTVMGLFWNNYRQLNRNYLLIGSVLGRLIPVANGLVTGDWVWHSLMNKMYFVFGVDATWLVIGVVGLLVCKYKLVTKSEDDRTAPLKILTREEELVDMEEPTPVLQMVPKKD